MASVRRAKARVLPLLPTMAVALALASCLKIDGDIRIRENGAGTITLKLALNRNAFALLPEERRFAFCDLGDMGKVLGKPQVRLAGQFVECTYSRSFPHIGYVNTEMLKARELDDGTWRLEIHVRRMLENTPLAAELRRRKAREGGGWQSAALPVMLREARLSVRVRAPHIEQSNGRVETGRQGEGQVAVFEESLAALLGLSGMTRDTRAAIPAPFPFMPPPASPRRAAPSPAPSGKAATENTGTRPATQEPPAVFSVRFWCTTSWFFGSPKC